MAWVVGGLVVVWLAVYAQVATFDLVFDDSFIDDGQARFETVWDGFGATQQTQMDTVQQGTEGFRIAYDSYRPLLFVSFRLDRDLFALSPAAMHLHSALLALALAFVLGGVLRRLGLTPTHAVAAAALFALHPLSVETTAYVSARGDTLAMFFGVVSAWLAVESVSAESMPRRLGLAVLCAVAWGASLLCKESLAALPLVFGIVALATRRVRPAIPVGVACVLVLVGYVALRSAVLGEGSTDLGREPLAVTLARTPALVAQGISVFVAPFDLSIHRAPLPALTIPGVLLGVLGVGALVAGALGREIPRPAVFAGTGIVCAFALLAPTTVAISDTGVVADRYFLPVLPGLAVGAVLGADALVRRYGALTRVGPIVVAAIGLVLGGVSFAQTSTWASNLDLYQRAVDAAPEHPMSWYRLGVQLARDEDWQRAESALLEALRRDENHSMSHNNLGVVYLNTRRFDEAAWHFSAALHITGDRHYRACYNLGTAHQLAGRGSLACSTFARCVEINPLYTPPAEALARHCTPAN